MTEILAHSVDNARMNPVSGVYNESRPRGAPSRCGLSISVGA
jgi:hypothetical protein